MYYSQLELRVRQNVAATWGFLCSVRFFSLCWKCNLFLMLWINRVIIRHNLHICVCSYFPHLVHQITIRVFIPSIGIRAGLWKSIDFWSIGSWFGDFTQVIEDYWCFGGLESRFFFSTVHDDLRCSSTVHLKNNDSIKSWRFGKSFFVITSKFYDFFGFYTSLYISFCRGGAQ